MHAFAIMHTMILEVRARRTFICEKTDDVRTIGPILAQLLYTRNSQPKDRIKYTQTTTFFLLRILYRDQPKQSSSGETVSQNLLQPQLLVER